MQIIEPKQESKIRLSSMYPYTFVRTNVMRSKLLQKHDYEKLLKMSYSEIAKFLQDTEYKSEINELAVRYSGIELIEIALNTNLAKTFAKLKRISPPELVLLIDAYLMKYDIFNLKSIIRGIYTNTPHDYVRRLFVPVGTLSSDFLDELLKKDSIDDIIKAVPFLEYKSLRQQIEALKEKGALFELENSLDKFYYNYIVLFSRKLSIGQELFKKFLLTEIETSNLLVTVRLMKEGFGKDQIKKYIFLTGEKEADHEAMNLLEAKNIENLAKYIRNRSLRKLHEKCIEVYNKSKSLIEFERMTSKYMLEKATLFVHQNLLSVNVILGFMFAKEIEIQNLIKIIKGKELGLDEAFIRSEIVA